MRRLHSDENFATGLLPAGAGAPMVRQPNQLQALLQAPPPSTEPEVLHALFISLLIFRKRACSATCRMYALICNAHVNRLDCMRLRLYYIHRHKHVCYRKEYANVCSGLRPPLTRL